MKVIIIKNDTGGVGVFYPTSECLEKYTIEEIAEKDVPAGQPYKIMEESELPQDHTFFNAWEINDEELTDGEGADRDYFLR